MCRLIEFDTLLGSPAIANHSAPFVTHNVFTRLLRRRIPRSRLRTG